MAKHFDGMVENRAAPRRCTGVIVFEMVKNIKFAYGKSLNGVEKSKTTKDVPFKKQSIYFRILN